MPGLDSRIARISVLLAALSCAPRGVAADGAPPSSPALSLPLSPVAVRAPIDVREEAGTDRTGSLVTAGIPVPLGARLTDVAALRVFDASGQVIPAQFAVLSRWDAAKDDRSAPVRWAMARFAADVPAHAVRRFDVRTSDDGEKKAATAPLARSEGGSIVVENGAFRASFGPEEPGPLVLVATAPGAGAKPVRAGKTTSVTLEENGPQFAEVRVEGELAGGFEQTAGGTKPLRWIARWTFQRGEPGAHALFTVENPDRPYEKPYNDRGAARGKRFASLSLELAGSRTLAAAGGPGAKTAQQIPKGPRGDGWIARGGSLLGMRRFAENGPKSLAARADGTLVLELFPKAALLGGGRAKSHDLFVLALPAGADPEIAAKAAAAPLRGAPDPAWLRDSGALGFLSVEDAKRFPDFEATADAVAGTDRASREATLTVERERTHAYGWMDFGDSLRGKDAKARRFGNNEFDFGWVLLRQWLREPGHDPAFRELAEDTLRHTMDIDVMHTADDAGWANHGMRKHDTDDTEDHSHGPDFSHFWLRGIVAWHLATGDGRAREVAVGELGAWIAAREEKDAPGALRFADELRDVGWAIVALTDLYELDGDPEKLALARRIAATMVLPNVKADGSMGGASFMNRHETFAPWQEAYIADGLGRLALIQRRRGAKDAGVEEALKRMLGYLCGDGAWVRTPTVLYGRTYGESLAFTVGVADGKKTVEEASMSQALADPAVFGFLLFEDPALRACAARSTRWTFPSGPEAYWKPDSATPAKNAAVKLYFAEAFRWLDQTRSDSSPGSKPAR